MSLRWALVSGATDYEVRYRTCGGAWSCKQLGAQSGAVQGQINLLRKRTYEFQLRAASEGRNAAAYWGPWWSSHEATTDPPAFPGISVGAVTDTTVTVSWQHIPGESDYLIQALHIGGAHNVEQSVLAPAGGSGAVSTTLAGLNPNSTYMVGARSHGDGKSYVRGWGGWGGWMQTRTAQGYAPAIEPPPLERPCDRLRRPRAASPWVEHRSPDGTKYEARAEIWGRYIYDASAPHYPEYCMYARFVSKPSAGAEALTRSGEAIKAEPSASPSDFSDLDNLTPGHIYAVYAAVPKSGGGRTIARTGPYTCPEPCMGGTIQSDLAIVKRRYIKTVTVYLEGSHTSTDDGVSHTLGTETELKIPQQGFYIPVGEVSGFNLLERYWTGYAAEVAADAIPNEAVRRIIQIMQE